MKVELLRKIRKEYSIVYFEAGTEVYSLGSYERDRYYVFKDNKTGLPQYTKKEALEEILRRFRLEYGHYKLRKYHTTGKKIWYNE